MTVNSLTVVESTETTATAEATVTVTDGSQSITESHDYELRRHEGRWAIWTFAVTESDGTATPTA